MPGRSIDIRTMDPGDIIRIGEIDRSEEISQCYVCEEGQLVVRDVQWSVPPWSAGADDDGGDHSVSGILAAWSPWLDGGTLLGGFDGETLAAVGIYRRSVAPDTAQLALLHVSRPHRRQGFGAAISTRIIEMARSDGASQLYVSATPTKGTVDFYQSLGFRLTDKVIPELFQLEPEDIHMRMSLGV